MNSIVNISTPEGYLDSTSYTVYAFDFIMNFKTQEHYLNWIKSIYREILTNRCPCGKRTSRDLCTKLGGKSYCVENGPRFEFYHRNYYYNCKDDCDDIVDSTYNISEISNYYGVLQIWEEGGKYYWGIDNYDKQRISEISYELFSLLLKEKASID